MRKINLVVVAAALLAAAGAQARIGGEWGGPKVVSKASARSIAMATQAAREDMLAGAKCVRLMLDGDGEVNYARC